MPLPPSAIEQLSREPARTPGWSGRLLMFSFTLFFLSLLAYGGLKFGYEPYLSKKIEDQKSQMQQLSQKVNADQQADILSFHSQLINVKKLLDGHIYSTNLFDFLERTTQANVYYSKLDFNTDTGKASLVGVAKTVKDATQQMQILESQSDYVKSVQVSNVTALTNGSWQFDALIEFKTNLTQQATTETTGTNGVQVTPVESAASTTASSTASTTKTTNKR